MSTLLKYQQSWKYLTTTVSTPTCRPSVVVSSRLGGLHRRPISPLAIAGAATASACTMLRQTICPWADRGDCLMFSSTGVV